MKKFLFLGIAATAMLASCSNDEVVEMNPQMAIGFESFVDKSTRATDITINNIGDVELYGWRTPDAGGTSEAIFNNKTLTISSDGSASYTPIQYWVGGYGYNFEAVKGATVTPNQTGSTLAYSDANAETDLVYATAKKDDVKAGADPGAVNLTFNHLLSKVKFTFINGFESTAAARITINNVTLHNVNTDGTVVNSTWTIGSTVTPTLVFTSEAVADIASGNQQGSTAHKYIIPKDGYKLTFDLVLDQDGVTTNYSHSVAALPTVSMAQGLSYNFTATITPKNIDPAGQTYPIVFTATVNDFDDQSSTGVTLDSTTSGN